MDRHLKYIIILVVCIILCNQFVHLYLLYKKEKTQYVLQQNNLITGSIYEFNMRSGDLSNILSFNALTNELIFQIDNKIKIFQLSIKDDVQKIKNQSLYDVRNPQSWTLKNFYTYLRTKQDSAQLKMLPIQFVIQDSKGRITDSYPEHLETLPSSPEYREPLGFISKDTLYATYHYPLGVFVQAAIRQIILTIIISALFLVSIVHLWQTIRNEKKSGKYRELFIHNLVHDLKRPVANQLKACYLLREAPPEKARSLLEQSQRQLNEMLQSINRMLLQSTDAHGLRLNVREFDLRKMLETLARKESWSTETEKRFDIQVDFRSGNPVLTGDYHFLFAVFQNFIDNALKYSGEQVMIRIICTDPDARHIEIRIEDNGFGISSGNLKHVFERFNRGDHQENRAIKGNGQGLYYARTVILSHGGKINIESEENKGTAIVVILPRKAKVRNKHKY